MNYNIIAYSVYIPLTLGLSVWVAKTLHKNTKSFLMESFKGREPVADATNNLLQTGFYLIAFGYSFMRMRIRDSHWEDNKMVYDYLLSTQQTIEELALKLGSFTLVLGILLFINFFIMLLLPKARYQQLQPIRVEENKGSTNI
jgi:hypothetical protein